MKRLPGEIKKTVATIKQGIGLVGSAAGGWTLLWALLLLIQGLLPAALVYLSKVAIDLLTPLTAGPSGATSLLSTAWPVFVLMPFLWIAGQVAASLIIRVRTIQTELVQDYIHSLIHDKSLELDMAFFDAPASYDLLHRARVDALSQPLVMLESFGAVIQNSITLLALAVMLASYALWLPLLLLSTALPGLWVVGRHVIREHRWRIANTPNERRTRYYDILLTEQAAAAEVRLFDLGDYFRSAFREVRGILRQGRFDLSKSEMRAELAAGVVSWTGGAGGMAWMLFRVLNGAARLGDLVLCYQSFIQGQKLLRSLFESAGRIYRSSLFLENLFEFLRVGSMFPSPPNPVPTPLEVQDGIRFDGVSFRYPDTERYAIEDFNLFLPGGTITAIVGHNGAGKSTLIKLLCRFYDPVAGRIRLDNVDLRDFSVRELRRRITVLFQQPLNYHTTAAENIALGDIPSHPDRNRIEAAARAAGADDPIQRLPNGYETVLGKWFGGSELSVGEWQRLALARAFLRDAPLLILDEPTSSMDSWAERDWLVRFRGMTIGKTTLIITHRFTSAMHADIIHVMDRGRVIESGTHRQLVAAGGHYAESWNAQMLESGGSATTDCPDRATPTGLAG
jgi:ATP-binding cassette, subfamily B, bacterial